MLLPPAAMPATTSAFSRPSCACRGIGEPSGGRRQALEFLKLAGIDQLADHEAASLPLGSRRLVEVARALCAQPGVVLLDEPARG